MSIENRVTTSRFGRLSLLGQIAGGIVGGALNEGVNQLIQGHRPSLKDMFLTPANAKRLTARLSEMRGAAMKVGQLISMDSGQFLPAEFSDLLARLRDDAHVMPLGQVVDVLNLSLGKGWEDNFEKFVFTPIAAASIGQVHRAVLKDGREVAVKVQYPGIKQSIDSDVDNVAGLLKIFRLLPEHLDFKPLLEEAKLQLHLEADYLNEGDSLKKFSEFIAADDRFAIPEVIECLTRNEVLTMTFMHGKPIESVIQKSISERNKIAYHMLELNFNEVFQWGLVQTDPNFANYRYLENNSVIGLLDFGATRHYDQQQRKDYKQLVRASIDGENSDIIRCAEKIGYLEGNEPTGYQNNLIELLRMVAEPLGDKRGYDFGHSDLAARMNHIFMEMRLKSHYGVLPPVDILFLHRKLAGLYLLLTKLRARLSMNELAVVKTLTL